MGTYKFVTQCLPEILKMVRNNYQTKIACKTPEMKGRNTGSNTYFLLVQLCHASLATRIKISWLKNNLGRSGHHQSQKYREIRHSTSHLKSNWLNHWKVMTSAMKWKLQILRSASRHIVRFISAFGGTIWALWIRDILTCISLLTCRRHGKLPCISWDHFAPPHLEVFTAKPCLK